MAPLLFVGTPVACARPYAVRIELGTFELSGCVRGEGTVSCIWEPVLKTMEAWNYKSNKMVDRTILHLSRLLLHEMQANTR